MSTKVQFRRGTTTEHNTFTGAVGEITVDTTKDTVVVHDGAAAGGAPLLREDQSNLPTSAPTTGIYNASGSLAISTGGSQRLNIDANGRLNVAANSQGIRFGTQANISAAEGAELILNNLGAQPIAFYTNNSERLRIDSSGRLGIGTSSPVYLVDAQGGRALFTANSETYSVGVRNRASLAPNGNFWIGATNAVSPDMVFSNNAGNERLRITDAGLVGIGNTPSYLLDVNGDTAVGIGAANSNNYAFRVRAGTTGLSRFIAADTSDAGYIDYDHNADSWIVRTNGSEAFRVDSSRRLLVGTSTARTNFSNSTDDPQLQIESANGFGWASIRNSNTTGGAYVYIAKSRGTGNVILQNNDIIGGLNFEGNDGSEFVTAAQIKTEVDGTPGANDMPGRLVFSTTADGASSPTERMRIAQNGVIMFGTTNPDPGGGNVVGSSIYPTGIIQITRDGGESAIFNRKSNDGTIVELRQDGVIEGTISVSGTTVSYNGAHLSRWSQIPGIDPHDKDARPAILRGTVMSNLDEMCDWIDPETDEPQANEQLNKTKISDVEGDKNVAGIFQSWDDDDDTWVNDYYLAMTGDFIIRIAEGVTVERGDLLMSAGDGTAKPQGDDIIRSKTIAKVTSTNVSCTYDDGSYCVPCVLMAC